MTGCGRFRGYSGSLRVFCSVGSLCAECRPLQHPWFLNCSCAGAGCDRCEAVSGHVEAE